MIIGGVLASIAAGLLTTLTPTSSVAAWVCYQLLNGVARGMLAQQPVTAIQANLSTDQLSSGTAVIVFCQNFGAAIFISLGQTVFQNTLQGALRSQVPEVDAAVVSGAGATSFRDVVPVQWIDGAVAAYNDAVVATFV